MLSLHAQLETEPRTRLNSAVKLVKHKILAITCHEGHKSSVVALQYVTDDCTGSFTFQ